MKRLPVVLSSLAFLLSLFAVHVAWRTKTDVQAFAHSLPSEMFKAQQAPAK